MQYIQIDAMAVNVIMFIIGMSDTHKEALRISRRDFLNTYVDETLLSELVSKGVITIPMKEEIDVSNGT